MKTSSIANFYKENYIMSMELSSMFSVAAFGHGDPGLNPGWFAVSNSN